MYQKNTAGDGYDIRRVDKVNVFVTWGILTAIIINAFINEKLGDAVLHSLEAIPVGLLSTALYFLPIRRFIKSLLFGLIPTAAITALFIMSGFVIDFHYILFAATAMIALYFQSRLIVVFGCIANTLMILLYIVCPGNFLGPVSNLASFLAVMIDFNGALIILYFLTKWGRNMSDSAVKKKEEADSLLEKLKDSFAKIEKGTDILNENITLVNHGIKTTEESSQNIMTAMNEMATAIQEEASNIYETNEKMTNSLKWASDTKGYAGILSEKSAEIEQQVVKSTARIEEMSNQNLIISNAVGSALATVNELQKSMEKITRALSEISKITAHINILALNAAIEAARAGEQGRGFAVVSQEIRNLAEETRRTAVNISTIINDVTSKSKETLDKVALGDSAAKQGDIILQDVNEYFGQMKASIAYTNTYILKSIQVTNKMAEEFIEIQKRVEGIASISEQNSASTEEVLSTLASENNDIVEISKSIESISKLSKDLKEMVEL